MKIKRIIDKRERTNLVVDLTTRELVRSYAEKWQVTMQEATDYLLGMAICNLEGLDFTKSPFFKRMKSEDENWS